MHADVKLHHKLECCKYLEFLCDRYILLIHSFPCQVFLLNSFQLNHQNSPVCCDSMFIQDYLSLPLSDLVTVSPQSNVTEDGLVETTDSGITTSPTTGFSTTDTKRTGTGVTDDNPNPTNATITAGEHVTFYKNHTHISTTSSPVTHTDRYHFNNSNQEINPTRTLNTSTLPDQSVASYQPTTLSNGSKVFRPTQETRNESVPHTVHPVVNSSTCPEESSTLGSITENSGATPTQSILNIKASEDEGNNYLIFHG